MFFKRNKHQTRNTAFGLDLGTSQIKATVVRREQGKLALASYAVQNVPPSPAKGGFDPQAYGAAIQTLVDRLQLPDRAAFVSISSGSAVVCLTELPRMPLAEAKNALKLNSTRYLRRDLSNFCLDAVELPSVDEKKTKSSKMKVLVGGASRDEVGAYREALTVAKVRPEVMELTAVSIVNAFQASHPTVQDQVVLLVDIGGRSTTISFVQHSQPLITRIMHFGGGQLSEYVGQLLALDPAAAEEEKIRMSPPVQALLKTAVSPLGRELRSSIDFFERQHESHVAHVFACGGSACSRMILDLLSESVGVRVETWNPVEALETQHFNGDREQVLARGPALTAAFGAAVARL